MKNKLLKRIFGIAAVALAVVTLTYSIGVFIGSMVVLPDFIELQNYQRELQELRANQPR